MLAKAPSNGLLVVAGFLIGWLLLLANVAEGDQSSSLALSTFNALEHQAIVVGVNTYTNRYVEELSYAVNDARSIETSLTARGYDVTFIADDAATPDRILEAVRLAGDRLAAAPPERRGNLVFMFSGHGFRIGQENYLGTVNTDPFDLAGSALPIRAIREEVSAVEAERTIMFIDACRNDPSKNAGAVSRRFAFDPQATGTAILYSTAPESLSYEDDEFEAGVFSHYLAEALDGQAADENGLLTFERVERYVIDKVVERSGSHYGRIQRPYIAGERSGRFVLGQVNPVSIHRPRENQTENRGFSWKRIGITLGVLAAGLLIAGASDSGDDDTGSAPVTLVVPTP